MHAHEALYGRRWEVGVRMGQGPGTFTLFLLQLPQLLRAGLTYAPSFGSPTQLLP